MRRTKGFCKKKRSIAGVLLLLFLLALTACGKKENVNREEAEKQEETKEETGEENEGADPFMDAVLMAVGEKNVSGREAMAYLYFLKRQYETGLGKEVWSLQIEDSEKFEDYAKQEVVDNLTQLKIICQQAEKEGISLDEEERYEAGKAAKALLSEASEEDIRRFGLDEECLTEIYKDNTLASKVFDVVTAQVDTNISDEDARQITIQYVMVSTKDMDEQEKLKARKKANKLKKEAKKTESFLNFASSNSDAAEVEMTFGWDNLPEEFGDAAMELKTGDISEVIEGNSGYYILYCISDFDEEATAAKKEALIEAERDRIFRERYTDWSENYTVVFSTTLWDEVSLAPENAPLTQNELTNP